MKRKERNFIYTDLCDIVMISNCTVEYHSALKERFMMNAGFVPPRPPSIEPTDLLNAMKGLL